MSELPVETVVEAGDSAWVEVDVATDLDGTPITIDAYVVNGTTDGPTVLCQGAVHGNEPVGGLAVREFVTELDPGAITGTVVGIPVANPPAFRERARGAPVHIGSADVNDAFPGSADGSLPQQIAATLFEIAAAADFVVDLHSADEQLVMHTSFAYVPAVGNGVQRRAREAAVAGGVEHVVELDPDEMDGFLTAELARRETPAIVVESGSGARVYEWALENYLDALAGITAELDVRSEPDTADTEPTFHEDLSFQFASAGGFVDVTVRGGDRVLAGEQMATITDVTGETVDSLAAPVDGVVMAVRTLPTARPGDLVVELAPERGAGGYSNRP
ncbi:succinylglutamate desuccinylase/aspartoacylase family protein [Halovenus marina]|uniref:succinylglutamate desuccinylase/aspartoacylase family protein n=1 Tax=Halovenus marina TaxID=3396621 RepID=UPI003F55723C